MVILACIIVYFLSIVFFTKVFYYVTNIPELSTFLAVFWPLVIVFCIVHATARALYWLILWLARIEPRD